MDAATVDDRPDGGLPPPSINRQLAGERAIRRAAARMERQVRTAGHGRACCCCVNSAGTD
ncbi:MAG: hypothetical protein ACPIOQ_53205 [Promethearchaeia archaeon]